MMKMIRRIRLSESFLVVVFIILFCVDCDAKLTVQIHEPKQIAGKAMLKLTLKSTFKEKIESVRATVFLLNEGKVSLKQPNVVFTDESGQVSVVGCARSFALVAQTKLPDQTYATPVSMDDGFW